MLILQMLRHLIWIAFRIKRNTTFNNSTKRLRLISYEEYLDKYVDYEYDTSTSIRDFTRVCI